MSADPTRATPDCPEECWAEGGCAMTMPGATTCCKQATNARPCEWPECGAPAEGVCKDCPNAMHATGTRLYRKRPVVIEAIQWDGSEESQREIVNWSGGKVSGWIDSAYYLAIRTLEGEMRADPGDWIIRGVQGEFYPCKPDIFDATYEKAGRE